MDFPRLDRFATLYCFHPLTKIFFGRKTRVVVLMYHSISPTNAKGLSHYYQINTKPETFKQHMEYISSSGYQVIPLSQLHNDDLTDDASRVVITFDDGYKDFIQYAYSILSKHGFPSTVFLSTGHVGKHLNGRECLSWEDIRFLINNNVTFGSHTVTHPELVKLSKTDMLSEIQDSIKDIEHNTGKQVSTFAYPYAFPQERTDFIRSLRVALEMSGVKIGVTTKIGCNKSLEDMLFLSRIPINTHDDLQLFRAKLEGGYDWLHLIQYTRRIFKHWI